MQSLDTDAAAAHLLEPVSEVLQRGLRLLPGGPPLVVRLAEAPMPEAFYRLAANSEVHLAPELAGPDLYHPLETSAPLPPLDRWRRAAASVLEAASLLEISRRTGIVPDPTDWRWMGAAIYAADTVAPSLSLAQPDLALALATGDLQNHPRAGVAAYQAWRQAGTDPVQQAQYLIEGGVVSAQEWLKLGGWVFDASGPSSKLPLPVPHIARTEVPATLGPWSWRPVMVPEHPRGSQVIAEGAGMVRSAWALGGQAHETFAVSTEGTCFFELDPGGPIGSWEVASAEAFGQIMGARGIQFTFHLDGRLTLLLTDAFVGPLAAVAMADELAASSLSEGRWSIAGPHQLGFRGLQDAIPLQGRRPWRFASNNNFGLPQWISALEEAPWAWRIMPDRLVLRGAIGGGAVEVRLRPSV